MYTSNFKYRINKINVYILFCMHIIDLSVHMSNESVVKNVVKDVLLAQK